MNKKIKMWKRLNYKSGDLFVIRRSETLRRARGNLHLVNKFGYEIKRFIFLLMCILFISCNKKYDLTILYEIEANSKDFVSIKIDGSLIYEDSVHREDKKTGDMFLLDAQIKKSSVKFEVEINNTDTMFYFNVHNSSSITKIFNIIILNLEKRNEWRSD